MKYIKSVTIKSVRYNKSFTELVLLQNVFDMLLFIPVFCVIALRNILLLESDKKKHVNFKTSVSNEYVICILYPSNQM